MRKIILTLGLCILGFCVLGGNKSSGKKAPDKTVIAEVLGNKISARNKKHLRYLIFGRLLDNYRKENKIKPTKEEIIAFVNKMQDQEKENRENWEKDKKDIQAELQSGKLSKQKKKHLLSRLKTIEGCLKVYPEEEKLKKENPEMFRKIHEKNAVQFIQQWKVNYALFKKYGGRVIFQQFGPEPIDAYRDFLKEQEKKGNFKIYDGKLKPQFWDYFVNDKHNFISKTKKEGEEIFEKQGKVFGITLENRG